MAHDGCRVATEVAKITTHHTHMIKGLIAWMSKEGNGDVMIYPGHGHQREDRFYG
jgi:hypothetical protein